MRPQGARSQNVEDCGPFAVQFGTRQVGMVRLQNQHGTPIFRDEFPGGSQPGQRPTQRALVLDRTVFPVSARRTAAGVCRADHGESVMNRIPVKSSRLRLAPQLCENLRHEVLCRDGWRCQSRGALSNLEVHHRELRSQSGDDAEQNLITLCTRSHSIVHRGTD